MTVSLNWRRFDGIGMMPHALPSMPLGAFSAASQKYAICRNMRVAAKALLTLIIAHGHRRPMMRNRAPHIGSCRQFHRIAQACAMIIAFLLNAYRGRHFWSAKAKLGSLCYGGEPYA